MKELVFSLFRGYSDKTPTEVSIDQVVNLIHSDKSIADLTEKYRYYQHTDNERDAERIKKQSLCFAVAVRFSEGKQQKHICGWTGLSMVDFDHLDATRVPEMLRLIHADCHTLLCYTTVSGKGIRILFRIEGLGDDPKQNLKRYETFFLKGNRYYAGLTGCEFDGQCKNATRLCGIAHDTEVFYNPDAEPFVLTPEDEAAEAKHRSEKAAEQFVMRAVKAAEQTLENRGITYEPGKRNAYIMQMGYLLNAYGIKPEDATRWALSRFIDYDGDVAAIFRSCYSHTDEFGKTPLYERKKGKSSKKRTSFASAAEIESFLNGQAQFRFNVVTGKTEYLTNSPSCHSKERSDEESENAHVTDLEILRRSTPLNDRNECWAEIDDRFVNSLWSRMCKQVKPVKASDLRAVLASEFVPPFNPFESYFSSLPPWDGQTDYIAELADTVTVKGDEQAFFVKYFKKWLVNMVASLLDAHILNHEILVFIGPQGCYKTTWMSRLLPPELERYFYIKANSTNITKDDHFTLSEFAIICLEELDAMASPHTSQLKALVSKPDVNERPAYGHYKERRPHLASFCGTTNNEQFLTDLTGNRRWLPIEVEAILNPHFHPVNYTGVYSQALALFRNGFPYYLSPAEVQEVNLRNRRYEVPCMEVELVQMLFIVPFPEATEVTFLTVTQILNRINLWSKHLLNPTKIGIAMKRAGFTPCRKKGIRGYRVIELPADRIQANAKLLGA